jgi:hypothetical protein
MTASAAIADSPLRRAWKRHGGPQAGRLAVRSVDILFQVCLPSSRLRVPVSLDDSTISRRTVMNNAGYSTYFDSNGIIFDSSLEPHLGPAPNRVRLRRDIIFRKRVYFYFTCDAHHVAYALLNHVHRKGSGNRSDAHSMSQEETDMEFATIIIISNVLMAVFIYIIVSKIWQD